MQTHDEIRAPVRLSGFLPDCPFGLRAGGGFSGSEERTMGERILAHLLEALAALALAVLLTVVLGDPGTWGG
jgi:hypothetical protein